MSSNQYQKSPTRNRTALLVLAVYASVAGIGVISALMPAPVHATSQETVRTMAVRFGDLDLASDRGVARLQHRISRAARQLCELDISLPLMPRKKLRTCVDRARASAWIVASNIISQSRLTAKATD